MCRIGRSLRVGEVEAAVIALLSAVLHDRTAELDAHLATIEEFNVATDRANFTLHGLYLALLAIAGCQVPHTVRTAAGTTDEVIDFAAFRAELYAGRVNEKLATRQLIVCVGDSTGKLESSWYQLRLLD